MKRSLKNMKIMKKSNSELKKSVLKSIIQGKFEEVKKLKKLMNAEKNPMIIMQKSGIYYTNIERTKRILSAGEVEELEKENDLIIINIDYPENMDNIACSEQEVRERDGII